MDKKSVGRLGESLAAGYLEDHGYQILARNEYTPHGEIDLIACQASPDGPEKSVENTIVFVEVKTRRTKTFGLPEDAVDARKQAHLVAAAQYYIQQHPELSVDWRLDVIAIQLTGRGRHPQVTHFENAIY